MDRLTWKSNNIAIVVVGGDRGSYQQWKEGDISPQIVFEILSPGNRPGEMSRKLRFYEQYGVEEYYVYDPDDNDFTCWIRGNDRLEFVDFEMSCVSPKLGIRFELETGETLAIYGLDGEPFLDFVDNARLRQDAIDRADQAENRADQAENRTTLIEIQAQKLAAKLRELGIEPDEL